MSTFEALALSKYPRDAVFEASRDALPLAMQHVDDIERVVVERRVDLGDTVELSNVWYGRMPVPDTIASVLLPHMLVWNDRALWTRSTFSCAWNIVSPYFPQHVRCHGVTLYGEAMRGQATRVALRGHLEVDASAFAGMPEPMQRALARGFEEFVCAMFPSALRKVVDGVSHYIADFVPPSR